MRDHLPDMEGIDHRQQQDEKEAERHTHQEMRNELVHQRLFLLAHRHSALGNHRSVGNDMRETREPAAGSNAREQNVICKALSNIRAFI